MTETKSPKTDFAAAVQAGVDYLLQHRPTMQIDHLINPYNGGTMGSSWYDPHAIAFRRYMEEQMSDTTLYPRETHFGSLPNFAQTAIACTLDAVVNRHGYKRQNTGKTTGLSSSIWHEFIYTPPAL